MALTFAIFAALINLCICSESPLISAGTELMHPLNVIELEVITNDPLYSEKERRETGSNSAQTNKYLVDKEDREALKSVSDGIVSLVHICGGKRTLVREDHDYQQMMDLYEPMKVAQQCLKIAMGTAKVLKAAGLIPGMAAVSFGLDVVLGLFGPESAEAQLNKRLESMNTNMERGFGEIKGAIRAFREESVQRFDALGKDLAAKTKEIKQHISETGQYFRSLQVVDTVIRDLAALQHWHDKLQVHLGIVADHITQIADKSRKGSCQGWLGSFDYCFRRLTEDEESIKSLYYLPQLLTALEDAYAATAGQDLEISTKLSDYYVATIIIAMDINELLQYYEVMLTYFYLISYQNKKITDHYAYYTCYGDRDISKELLSFKCTLDGVTKMRAKCVMNTFKRFGNIQHSSNAQLVSRMLTTAQSQRIQLFIKSHGININIPFTSWSSSHWWRMSSGSITNKTANDTPIVAHIKIKDVDGLIVGAGFVNNFNALNASQQKDLFFNQTTFGHRFAELQTHKTWNANNGNHSNDSNSSRHVHMFRGTSSPLWPYWVTPQSMSKEKSGAWMSKDCRLPTIDDIGLWRQQIPYMKRAVEGQSNVRKYPPLDYNSVRINDDGRIWYWDTRYKRWTLLFAWNAWALSEKEMETIISREPDARRIRYLLDWLPVWRRLCLEDDIYRDYVWTNLCSHTLTSLQREWEVWEVSNVTYVSQFRRGSQLKKLRPPSTHCWMFSQQFQIDQVWKLFNIRSAKLQQTYNQSSNDIYAVYAESLFHFMNPKIIFFEHQLITNTFIAYRYDSSDMTLVLAPYEQKRFTIVPYSEGKNTFYGVYPIGVHGKKKWFDQFGPGVMVNETQICKGNPTELYVYAGIRNMVQSRRTNTTKVIGKKAWNDCIIC